MNPKDEKKALYAPLLDHSETLNLGDIVLSQDEEDKGELQEGKTHEEKYTKSSNIGSISHSATLNEVPAPRMQQYPVQQPNIPSYIPHQGVRQQQVENRMLRVHCGMCKLLLEYPPGAYIVQCPACKTNTAATNLSQIKCGLCHIILYYPTDKNFVYCPCGALNSVRPIIQSVQAPFTNAVYR